ncbi:aminopeptidase [Emticicia sp. W12TSBA100-4]|uniref:aminopeptidase n=1 Tax=Emticicia sp. W12TSBA100-4 TaxID=3160965 RepID=UPI003305A923
MKKKIFKILKYSFLGLLVALILFIAFNLDSSVYAYRQAKGQLKIIFNTRPVSEVLADKSFPDSLKKRILLIEEIKRFAVDSLGLNPSDNYTTFYDQHQKPILWVITACEPFELKARKWDFPIVGTFSYKGHFEKVIADAELSELKKQGFDTQLNEVSAWSTLGYLKDPILSSMLEKSEGRLAALIIHELTHGTLFVKNNLEFNENLADFVGDYGAIRFLTSKYGKNSKELERYQFSKKYSDAYSQHLLRGAKKLDSLYKNFDKQMTIQEKKRQKIEMISTIINKSDTLLAGEFQKRLISRKKWALNDNNLPNNAYFIGYLTYQSKQNQFKDEFVKEYKGNFNNYLTYLKNKYPSSIVF